MTAAWLHSPMAMLYYKSHLPSHDFCAVDVPRKLLSASHAQFKQMDHRRYNIDNVRWLPYGFNARRQLCSHDHCSLNSSPKSHVEA